MTVWIVWELTDDGCKLDEIYGSQTEAWRHVREMARAFDLNEFWWNIEARELRQEFDI